MKPLKYLFLISSALCICWAVACQNSGNRTEKRKPSNATDSTINASGSNVPSAFREGAELISRNDCFTCHAVDSTVKGPAFKKIAQKYHHYEGVLNNLAYGIIHGSKGIWGEQQMTPHPNLQHADARKMIEYIFSLDSTHTYDTSGTYGRISVP